MPASHPGASDATRAPHVAILGGGLAGLSAAVGLCEHGFTIDLFEARRSLGGRATTYRDPASDALVDNCQHVSMGCCTNLAQLCRQTGLDALLRRHRTLHFFDPEGRRFDLQAASWLPAPLHLAPSLLGLRYLSLGVRLRIARGLWRLMRLRDTPENRSRTAGAWLREIGQSQRAIDWFWSVVLVSALSEAADHIALMTARKVFVDGMMTHREAYCVDIPEVSLGELYGERLLAWLAERGVRVHLSKAAESIEVQADGRLAVKFAGGAQQAFDYAVVAVPWRRAAQLLPAKALEAMPSLALAADWPTAPITSAHLWYDRPITELPHAVLVGRLSQWLFRRADRSGESSDNEHTPGAGEHYYQVVISASRNLAGRERDEVIREIEADLQAVFPAARQARLLRGRLISEQHAVYSPRPDVEAQRPTQATGVKNLALAGDWTQTGWPATMEGAVRSGYLAAEEILCAAGEPRKKLLGPDLPVGWLSKLLVRAAKGTP